MKTHTKSLGKVFGFVLAGALVAPLVGQAAALETATVAVDGVGRESSVVSGRVSAKGGGTLTVNGDSLVVTGATAFIKDAVAISAADIKVGDEVRVAVTKSADGTLQALSVEVLKAAD